MHIAFYELVLGLFVKVALCREYWPSLSAGAQLALRSQRDLGVNVSIDQLYSVGVNVDKVIGGDKSVNETQSLMTLNNLLKVGVQSYVVDLNVSDPQNFMLPSSNISFSTFLTAIRQYVSSSNNYLNANILILLLRPNFDTASGSANSSFSSSPSQSSPLLSNMTAQLETSLGLSAIYTPSQLLSDRAQGITVGFTGDYSKVGWPPLEYFLYKIQKRVLVAYVDSNVLDVLPSDYVFDGKSLNFQTSNITNSCPSSNTSELAKVVENGWRFLESQFLPSDIREYVMCGYSPIISNHYTPQNISDIADLLETSLPWSWAHKEPNSYDTSRSNSTSLVARRCAVVHYVAANSTSYWAVANCYDKRRTVCRHEKNNLDWRISKSNLNYFSTHDQDDNDVCPENYTVGLPKSPLEETALNSYLSEVGSEGLDAWIDMNSISVPDCWVAGGSYASCPYQKEVSSRSFVGFITPVSIFTAITLALLFFLTWRKVPIQDNRKHWKKIVSTHSTLQKEGVPS
ncbi:LAFA_0E02608g1_1 [Lachancea sp. 'fantastica']|nr:LAFA_0E02608g1_1 [Lachancea sp. 'fantastica']